MLLMPFWEPTEPLLTLRKLACAQEPIPGCEEKTFVDSKEEEETEPFLLEQQLGLSFVNDVSARRVHTRAAQGEGAEPQARAGLSAQGRITTFGRQGRVRWNPVCPEGAFERVYPAYPLWKGLGGARRVNCSYQHARRPASWYVSPP